MPNVSVDFENIVFELSLAKKQDTNLSTSFQYYLHIGYISLT